MFQALGYSDKILSIYNIRYKCYTKLKKKYQKYIGKTEFTKYQGDEKNKIWICWLQGIDSAPELVQTCLKSIKYHIKDMEIVILDKNNIKDYITLPDYIYDKWERGIIPNAQFSDIIRNELIIEHGGLWLDSTLYFTDKLPDYIIDSDFFVYRHGWFGEDVINMGNWLIYSKNANNIILQETQNLLFKYWKDHNYLLNYFLMHLFVKMVSEYYQEEWKQIPYYDQINQHIFQMELLDKYNEKRFNQIKELSSIHKLTYKLDESEITENCYYSKLDELYK
jgi:hypothetical protein